MKTKTPRKSSRLKGFLIRLGELPSLLFVGVYIVLIFVFSILFYLSPSKSFYHVTAQYEYAQFQPENAAVEAGLRDLLIDIFKKNHSSNSTVIRGWGINTDDVVVHSLDTSQAPDVISFKIYINLTPKTEELPKLGRQGFKVALHNTNSFIIDNNDSDVFMRVSFANDLFEATGLENIVATNPLTFQEVFSLEDSEEILVPERLFRDVQNINSGYSGFPSNIRGQYWRMLYLSAGIASSNALGDIVPVTNQARLLVTTEAILGLIIIGLFLNALAFDIAKFLKNDSEENPVKKKSK